MSARFDLYGVKSLTLEEVARDVAAALGVEFSLRNSSYKGGDYYFYRGADRLEISVEGQRLDDEGILVEPEFPNCTVLVYVNHSTLEIERSFSVLKQVELLRMEAL